jgi:membrane fusion protein (multidrug efflux system)
MKYDLKNLKIKLSLIDNNKNEVKRLQKLIDAYKDSLISLIEESKLINQQIKDSYLYSPINAKIAKRFANTDEVIRAGSKVFSIVDPKSLYVLDLLEETKLKGIKRGCKVKIHIDATNKDYEGVVDKILPASAATFALVPRDISSGEFTKLAQRFYVRIKFVKIPKDLLVGMSGEVLIKRCGL